MNVNAQVQNSLASMNVVMPRAGAGFEDNKLMIFGEPGSGKTNFLVSLVTQFDEKLLVVSTEQGGGGLSTLANGLAAASCPEKFHTNVFSIDLSDYSQVVDVFLRDVDPKTGKKIPRLYAHYPELRDFRPTVLVWEGMTNFQGTQVNSELLGEKEMELNDNERWAYWGTVKTTTSRVHSDFLSCTDPDYQWHHILTVHEMEDVTRDSNGKVTKVNGVKPEIAGGGARAVYQAYNLILNTMKTRKEDPVTKKVNTTYTYRTQAKGSEDWEKCRGYDLEGAFAADAGKVWGEMNRVRELMLNQKETK